MHVATRKLPFLLNIETEGKLTLPFDAFTSEVNPMFLSMLFLFIVMLFTCLMRFMNINETMLGCFITFSSVYFK